MSTLSLCLPSSPFYSMNLNLCLSEDYLGNLSLSLLLSFTKGFPHPFTEQHKKIITYGRNKGSFTEIFG